MKNYKAIVIKAKNLIDGLSGRSMPDAGVLIEGDKIQRVSPWNSGSPWPEGEGVLKLDTEAVIPGLINIHVHITGEEDLAEYIKWGVTSVRDVGTDPYNQFESTIYQARDEIESGARIGPRIFSYGFIIDGPNSIFPQLSVQVGSPEEAAAEVDRQADFGVDGIKLYYKLTPAMVKAIVERAAEHDLPTAGHIGMLIGGVEGARIGIGTIEHLVSFMRDLFPPFIHPAVSLMVKAGFMDNPAKGLKSLFNIWRKIDTDDKKIKKIAGDFSDTGSVFHPTIIALERMTRIGGLIKEREPRFEKMLENVIVKDLYRKTIPEKWNEKTARLGKEGLDGMLRFVKLMHRTGVPMGVGTDDSIPFVFPGESIHQEMELFVRAGVPPIETISMATARNAETLRRPDLGVIAEGKTADLVLLKGNPADDISATRDISCVIKGGSITFPV